MKNALILVAVGVGAYGLWLNSQRKKKSLPSALKLPIQKKPVIYPDSVLKQYDVDQRKIFAGGEFREIPWPESVNQNYILY